MKYRTLGRTGLKVSVVGIGTWQFGGEWGVDYTQSDVDAILGKGKELGINLIDTAECYGDHLSEKLIGGYLRRDRREDWIIATKFGHHFHAHLKRDDRSSAEDVREQLEQSLRALGTDYIDIYQFHSLSDERFNNDDMWTMLDKQVQAGKIRHLGISIGYNGNIYQTKNATKVKADVIQVVYNRLDRTPEEEVFPSCQDQNLGVLARVPLASGFLSGKYSKDSVFPENDVRASKGRNDPEGRIKMIEEVERIRKEEVPEGVNMAEWALAWCLKHPAVTAVIPGCKDPSQVESNARAAKLVQE
ncbi:aldo/keto reductase [Paenibacillus cisolokensis]|jgi:Predicted oxidoreductases (related to aryl-alcohol dehydrogenases)|uniref:Aldo/keto reductase n=1 Tax=Paenibacillus cisolokensis TaxID=1658519 RepID=A0ABQ4N6C4_9BACL|nr:aldo/keto reductase [Paenibacillus cisolokensis]GIQ63765.1 aldo/keto reductase [Paenibacillus cisolokensis]